MREILSDIRNLLNSIKYKNEEQVRFSLVARILQKLDWDIWDPEQVYTEYRTNQKGDTRKVDLALFCNGNNPSIFIEVKSSDKLNNSVQLAESETQLKDYNADLTALFTILTDGNQWRFYYSQEGGFFSEKCFKILKLVDDDIDDIESAFLTYLKRDVVLNGKAKNEAHDRLLLNRSQKIMDESLPQAKREIEDGLITLVDALKKIVEKKGFIITDEEALKFIKEHNLKKESTNIVYQEPITEVSKTILVSSQNERKDYSDNLPDLTHTRVESGIIGKENGNNWKKLLDACLRQLINSGLSKEKLREFSRLNIMEGHSKREGFSPINGTMFSLQGVDANKAASELVNLAKHFGLRFEVEFQWRDKPDAAFPNKKGRIKIN